MLYIAVFAHHGDQGHVLWDCAAANANTADSKCRTLEALNPEHAFSVITEREARNLFVGNGHNAACPRLTLH